ncbi:hypothetical protein N0V95_004498 [Ascochyta clinopodiicola]|nr:hypothetical protein N0V95_004498 [Ascochyta clinopodiicola]
MSNPKIPGIPYDSTTDFFDDTPYHVPDVTDPGSEEYSAGLIPHEVVLAAWLTAKAKEQGKGKIRAIPHKIDGEVCANGVALLTNEQYVWDAPTSPPSKQLCMADVDFQAASAYLRPPSNSCLLLAVRLLPERGIFERTDSPKYNYASVNADEPCKVLIIAGSVVKRIWIGWTADFISSLPSFTDAKARTFTQKDVRYDADFQRLPPQPIMIATDDHAEREFSYTEEKSRFLAAREVKDWSAVHQKLQEMAYDSSRPYEDRYLLGSEVRRLLWRSQSKKSEEWRSTYNELVADAATDRNVDSNADSDADGEDGRTSKKAAPEAKARAKTTVATRINTQFVKKKATKVTPVRKPKPTKPMRLTRTEKPIFQKASSSKARDDLTAEKGEA